MNEIKITKSGFIKRDWNSSTHVYDESLVSKNIFTILNKTCELESGLTLLDLFNVVDQFHELCDFMAQFSHCRHLKAFHEQARLPYPEDKDQSKERLDYLEVYKHNDVLGSDFEIYEEFHGIGHYTETPDYDESIKPGDPCNFSVSYSPMNEIAHLELKLNEKLTIHEPFDHENPTKPIDRVLLQTETYFTVLQILHAIYDDISWNGSPEGNAKFVEELRQTVDGIKSGAIKTVPFDPLSFKIE